MVKSKEEIVYDFVDEQTTLKVDFERMRRAVAGWDSYHICGAIMP